jgi:uncharacterized protein YndB with AHSA1/START domain
MIMMSRMGVIGQDEQGGKVHFERFFDIPPLELWPYLTEARHLSSWITPKVEFEARVGGRVRFAWADSPPAEGEVLVCDPPHRLEYTWRENDSHSVVKLELQASAGGTLLLVDHVGLPIKDASGFGAGWHSHFDWLDHVIGGTGGTYDEKARFKELAAQYGYEMA